MKLIKKEVQKLRRSKKAALELSINAIVIVILAMTLLGLGLGFIRNMISDIEDTTGSVQDQIKEQVLDDLRRGDKKLSFPSQQINLEAGQDTIIAIGVKNTDPSPLNFKIALFEINKDTGTSQEVEVISDLSTGGTYSYLWDDTDQTLSPGDSNVYGLTLNADRTATGTKLFKIRIVDLGGDLSTDTDDSEYTSKTYFVKFV